MTTLHSKIAILDKNTANQIAAGEVIENPSSVVKELVENSIDAGSTHIQIRVVNGGIDEIIVQDNGYGMTKEELALAFERHATSKISIAEDLYALKTLGFRGEALPSIASIAKVTATSKPETTLLGWQVTFLDGAMTSIQEHGCNNGTTVHVKELFYNTPARKKYLQGPLKEMSKVTDIVCKLALGYPEVSFSLINNGKQILKTPGSGRLGDVITALWGIDMVNNVMEICSDLTYSSDDYQISGYIGNLTYHRPNRNGQFFFVNNRYVKSSIISLALQDGYSTLLPISRFPFAIIMLSIKPNQLDVNIHPTKLEVKFSEPEQVKFIITQRIKNTIEQRMNRVKLPILNESPNTYYSLSSVPIKLPIVEEETKEQITFTEYTPPPISLKIERAPEEPSILTPSPQIDELRVIGQLFQTYIVCEGDDGLYLIDQHAAHERIIYNQLLHHEGNYQSQQLLFPVTVDLLPSESDIVVDNILDFSSLGFVLEHFGGSTFVIREVPQDLPKGEEVNCFHELLAIFKEVGLENKLSFREKYLILMSCRKAIKAGKNLSSEEMEYILAKLQTIPSNYTCPHGRPTIISFKKEHIANKFIRK